MRRIGTVRDYLCRVQHPPPAAGTHDDVMPWTWFECGNTACEATGPLGLNEITAEHAVMRLGWTQDFKRGWRCPRCAVLALLKTKRR